MKVVGKHRTTKGLFAKEVLSITNFLIYFVATTVTTEISKSMNKYRRKSESRSKIKEKAS